VVVEDELECECFDCQHSIYPGGVPDKGVKINGNLRMEELEKLLGDLTIGELEYEPVKPAASGHVSFEEGRRRFKAKSKYPLSRFQN